MKTKKEKVDSYLEKTRNFGPSSNAFFAVNAINDYQRRALDLGCGSFRNSKFLFNCGFAVDAIDKDPRVKNYTEFFKQRLGLYRMGRNKALFNLKIANYLHCNLGKGKYDIVVSENSLSFNKKDEVQKIVNKIYFALKNEGYFVGNLYGLDDFRSGTDGMSFYSKKEVESLLNRFKIRWHKEYESEDDYDGKRSHLHTFEFVVQKKESKI